MVASLTLPGLNSNINNRRIGPALAKALNNLENANRMILVENEISTLNEGGVEDYFVNLADTLNAARDGNTFTGKDGISYTFETPAKVSGVPSRKYLGSMYRVGIDVNGINKRPNLANFDRFLVYVDARGAVIPAGGREITLALGANHDHWNILASCAEGVTVQSSPNFYGVCTEAVINAGWEVTYIPVSSGVEAGTTVSWLLKSDS